MLDFFTIFTKSGIVLWYFETTRLLASNVNRLIEECLLQEKAANMTWNIDSMTLKCAMDNEFNLLYVVGYQKVLQLSYVDKFLREIQLRFRDSYKNDLAAGRLFNNFDFSDEFRRTYRMCEMEAQEEAKKPKVPRKWEESAKSQKTIASLLKKPVKENESKRSKDKKSKSQDVESEDMKESPNVLVKTNGISHNVIQNGEVNSKHTPSLRARPSRGKISNRPKAPPKPVKRVKQATVWNEKVDMNELDYSAKTEPVEVSPVDDLAGLSAFVTKEEIGSAKGELKPISSVRKENTSDHDLSRSSGNDTNQNSKLGFLSGLTGLLNGKVITIADLEPVTIKMKEHLIEHNVAAEVAEKICASVKFKLEGRTLGTFQGLTSTVKTAIRDTVLQILTPNRTINVLRDAFKAKKQGRSYVITFCGVNGVGKSTNLAKIAFWLIENDLSILIAACDTFRSGAVEQLQTHVKHLNAVHPPEKHGGCHMVQLYQKGYGRDAAEVAYEAINFAKRSKIDVVLIDTAGRMQDNEPLMKALSKLIHKNQPDLVLFVGEALVGNEAVDQVKKFNQSLADFTTAGQTPRLIDGIVLTKFDTVDDKVGAAVSMSYTTGQPIVFVGTGQTYSDLRILDVDAVVNALLK